MLLLPAARHLIDDVDGDGDGDTDADDDDVGLRRRGGRSSLAGYNCLQLSRLEGA